MKYIARFNPGETQDAIITTIAGIIGTMTLTNEKLPVRVTVATDVFVTLRGDGPPEVAIARVPVVASSAFPQGAFDIDEGVEAGEPIEMPPVEIKFMPHPGKDGKRHAGFVADAVPWAIVAVPKPDGTAVMVSFSGTPAQHVRLIQSIVKHGIQCGVLDDKGRPIIKPEPLLKL